MIQHHPSVEPPHEHSSQPCNTARILFSAGWFALCLAVVLAGCGTTTPSNLKTRAPQTPEERLNSKVIPQAAQLFDRDRPHPTR